MGADAPRLHPTAIVSDGAEIGPGAEVGPGAVLGPGVRIGGGVRIGPYAVVGPEVSLGDGCEVGPHAVLEGPASFGRGNRFAAHAAVGGAPQDLKYGGGSTRLVAGEDNVFREFCTVHRGTEAGGGVTTVGSRCLVMAYAHVAHDCVVGDGVIMANGASLGGHVVVEDGAVLGALVGVHQFVRVGRLAMVAAGAMVSQDVPPFTLAQGDRARLFGLNAVGLRRAGWGDADVRTLKAVYRMVLGGRRPLAEACADARAAHGGHPLADALLDFVARGGRGVLRGA